MAKTLQQILGYVTLTGLIESIKTGIPNPLPPAFFSTTRQVIGDAGRYTRVTGQRRVGRTTRYGSPAKRRELKDIATRDVKLMHLFEEQPIPPLVMQQLRNYEDYNVQQMGMQEVSRQTKEFVQLFLNFRIATTLMVLANGRLGFDSDGNLLADSSYSSAAEQVDFGMSSDNQGQLNGIIGASWATSTTNIPGHLRALKERAARLTGYELKYALYGKNIPGYFTKNDYVIDYLARNPSMQAAYLESADLPAGLFGLQWLPGYVSFWEDQNGTNRSIIGDDTVVFFPEISGDWWELLEGSYLVPTTINLTTDAATAMGSMKQVYGMFGFGQVGYNPPTVMTYYGDTFLPVLKVPDAIYQADVTP